MAQMRSLLIATALTTTIFACNKDDRNVDPSTANTASSTSTGSAGIGYRLVPEVENTTFTGPVVSNNITTQATMTWTDAYMRVTDLHFHAKMMNGNNGNGNNGNGNGNGNNGNGNGNGNNGNNNGGHVHYKSSITQIIDLFNPMLIGTVNVPYGTYDNVMVKMRIASGNNAHALYLEGVFTVNNVNIPVYVIVDQSMELMAKWKDPITISSNNYLSELMLSFAQLTNGIDLNTLQGLTITNGTIVISGNSNAQVYNLLLNNLQGMLKVKFQ